MKFYRIKSFNERFLFDRGSLNNVKESLTAAGFSDLEFKIPLNRYKNISATKFSFQEFVELEYNFVAQILMASKGRELVKVLFVNNSGSKAILDDIDFPSSHSVSSGIYVESDDPVRLSGMMDFIESLVLQNSLRSIRLAKAQQILFTVSSFYLFLGPLGAVTIFNDGRLSTEVFLQHWFMLIILPLLSAWYILYHTIHPGGLYIRGFEHPIVSFYRRLSAGDLRNNLLVVFIIWIFKIVIAGVIIGVLVNLLTDPIKELVSEYLKFTQD